MEEPIMRSFAYTHLPPHLQTVSKPFWDMAETVVTDFPCSPERAVALRKLLELKDDVVRAALAEDPA